MEPRRAGRLPRLPRAAPAMLLLLALNAAFGDDAGTRLQRLTRIGAGQQPVVRIGLEPAHGIAVDCNTAYRILDPTTGDDVWKPEFDGPLQVIADGGPPAGVSSIYRVQIGAFGSADAAGNELRRLQSLVGGGGIVHHDADRGNYRVRLGEAEDREALAPLMERLRREGLQGIWIAEEPAQTVSGVSLRLVDARYDSRETSSPRLALVPAQGGRMRIDGKSYRGIVELRISPFGTVRPVNWIGLEDYLLGVVPAELGPEVWPQLEALKAQAVAARTYVWRNLEQFDEEGFDLCATPRCQVYAGADAEHPLSDRAVASTTGEIMTHEDRPIVALYTATCGGHTESGGEIFPEHDEPYLTGVPCRAEGAALARLSGTVVGRTIQPLIDESGVDVTRDAALLAACGVIDANAVLPGSIGDPLDPQTLREWTGNLGRLAGRPDPGGPVRPTSTLGSAAAALLEDLGWIDRTQVLLHDADIPALLRDPECDRLPDDQRRALAYLAWTESLRPQPDGRFHAADPVGKGRLIPALAGIGERYEAFGLHEAVVSGIGSDSVRVIRGKGEVRLPLGSTPPRLFKRTGGAAQPVARLELWPGDRVRYRQGDGGAIDFLELMPPVKGTADDRSSRLYSWEARQTRSEIEAAINRRVAVGRIEDIRVARRGVSGRAVELEIVGTKASTTVRGFDVRRLLDLRESLVVVEIQRDPHGRIEAVVFAGKGWGHGVGLCQVGAYGMALRGAAYDEILRHYYRGARLSKLDRSTR